jgi:hypothetical protein
VSNANEDQAIVLKVGKKKKDLKKFYARGQAI